MKTKLEIGKEYWLDNLKDESGTFIGLDGGTILFKPSKNCVSYLPRNGYVIFGDSGREYCEVVSEKPWSFTTPIAMKCTEEQFNEIKGKLVEMGYSGCLKTIYFDRYEYLTNRYGQIGHVDSTDKYISKGKVSNWFESFNPDLFLALAAMTDKEDGVKGEWWKSGLTGKLIMQSESSFSHPILRKATAQEIIEHFERKEFLLQPRWSVELTESNRDIVIPWHKSIDKCSGRAYDIGAYYGIFENGTGDAWSSRELASQYQIITNDQFKKYVLKETSRDCQIIPIPQTKQATLFYDRVEITDWKPKEGDAVWVVSSTKSSFEYKKYIFDASIPFEVGEKVSPFIKRTESEAKQLVEKLKQAML